MRDIRSIAGALSVLSALALAVVVHAAPAHPAQPAGAPPSAAAGVTTVRELPALRTENSVTYLRSDGSRLLRIADHPINMKRNGSWTPIEDRLVKAADGSWGPASSPVPVALPGSLRGNAVRIGSGPTVLSLALQDGEGGTGVTDRAERTYAGVMPGVDVSYATTPQGVRETLTVADRSAPSEYRYALGLPPGSHAVAEAGGALAVRDAGGRTVYTIAAPTIADSSKVAIPSVRPVHYALNAQGTMLTLVVDKAWLADPSRVFPVKIDPDVYFGAIKDCTIANGEYENAELCGGTLYLGHGAEEDISARLVLDYDLSSIPTGSQILSSSIALWLRNMRNGTSIPVDAYALTRGFTGGVTWNKYDGEHAWSSPGGDYSESPAGSTVLKSEFEGGWVSVGLSPQIEQWVREPSANFGIVLKAHDETIDNVAELVQTGAETGEGEPDINVIYEPKLGDDGGSDRMLTTQEIGEAGETAQVNVANGNLLLSSPDVSYGEGEYETSLTRSWNSLDDELVTSSFGDGWRLNMGEDTLLYPAWWDGSEVFHEPVGMYTRFDRDPGADGSPSEGDLAYNTPAQSDLTLIRHEDGTRTLTFNETGVKWEFDASENGFPQEIIDPNGAENTISLTYTSSRLTGVSDTHGNSLTLTRAPTGPNDITKISQGEEAWEYGYESGDLSTVKAPGGSETHYTYGSGGLITKIVNPSGTYVISYDSQLRATEIRKLVNGTVTTPGSEDETTELSYKAPEGPLCSTERDAGETVVTYGPGESTPSTYCYNAAGEETAFSGEEGAAEEEASEFEEQPTPPSCYDTERYCGGEDPPGENEEFEEEESGGLSAFATSIPADLSPSQYGISDNNKVKEGTGHFNYFANNYFTALGVKKVRRIVPWNLVAAGGTELSDTKAWVEKVVALHGGAGEPLISFQLCPTEWTDTSSAKHKCNVPPDVASYKQAMEEFFADPVLAKVKHFTAWNEPNHPGQPTAGTANAELAGEYWLTLDELCRPSVHSCTVAAGDFSDTEMANAVNAKGPGGKYFELYRKGMNHSASVWAWHTYTDGLRTATNFIGKPASWWPAFRHFREAINKTSKKHPDIWLSEQGVIYTDEGRNQPAANDDKAMLIMHHYVEEKTHPAYQLTRLSRQIRSFYYYEMRGEKKDSGHQDSGLLNPIGKPRNIYYVYRGKTH